MCFVLQAVEGRIIQIMKQALQENQFAVYYQPIFSVEKQRFTSAAALIRLQKYPFRIVKIDKSMVWAAMEDEKAMYALKYTMAMVKAMGMELVAEGVENEDHIFYLESIILSLSTAPGSRYKEIAEKSA